MFIYCPNNTVVGNNNDCNIRVDSSDEAHSYMLDGMIFYALEGLIDVNIECLYGSDGFWEDCFDGRRSSTYEEYPWLRMNCGIQYQYFCNMSVYDDGVYDQLIYVNNDSCQCNYLTQSPTTAFPTAFPSHFSSSNPTPSPQPPSPTQNPTTQTDTYDSTISGLDGEQMDESTTSNTGSPELVKEANHSSGNNMIIWIIVAASIVVVAVILIIVCKLKKKKSVELYVNREPSLKMVSSNSINGTAKKAHHLQVSSGIMMHELDVTASPTHEVSVEDNIMLQAVTTGGEGDELVEEVVSNVMDNILKPENDQIIDGDDEIVTEGGDLVVDDGQETNH